MAFCPSQPSSADRDPIKNHAKANRAGLAHPHQTPLCHVLDSGQDDRGLRIRLFAKKAVTSLPQPHRAAPGQTVWAGVKRREQGEKKKLNAIFRLYNRGFKEQDQLKT